MTVRSVVALLLAGISVPCVSGYQQEMSWERAKQLLGRSVEELRAIPDLSVSEDADYVDEDEVTVHTQRWQVSHPDGSGFVVISDDGMVNVVWVLSHHFATDRGVRVGDTLADVKRVCPDSKSFDGSADALSTAFRLYAENGNLSFTFRGEAVWEALKRGETIPMDDPRVRDFEVWLISLRDGNRFACGEEFPCTNVPDWMLQD